MHLQHLYTVAWRYGFDVLLARVYHPFCSLTREIFLPLKDKITNSFATVVYPLFSHGCYSRTRDCKGILFDTSMCVAQNVSVDLKHFILQFSLQQTLVSSSTLQKSISVARNRRHLNGPNLIQ